MPYILYTPNARLAWVVWRLLARVTLTTSAVAAGGLALLGADLTSETVEALTDDSVSVIYTNDVGDVTGNLLLTGISVQSDQGIAAYSPQVRG